MKITDYHIYSNNQSWLSQLYDDYAFLGRDVAFIPGGIVVFAIPRWVNRKAFGYKYGAGKDDEENDE